VSVGITGSYLSLFSGIGGLEHPDVAPVLFCEKDSACQSILRATHPSVCIVDDIRTLSAPPLAEFVVGGWPCQDISSAGVLGGIRAARSGLFFEMLRTAKAANAHTIIGENVPNLLTIDGGNDFQVVLQTLSEAGYAYIGWRVLNAKQFGLPQQRRRLFVVASRFRERAVAIHASIPPVERRTSNREACAFYWTGGKRSICFCRGFSPALKIGATDNNGRAPVAVMLGNQIRKLSPRECLRLQGFDGLEDQHTGLSPSTLLRMAGNAVPRPMGHFVVQKVACSAPSDGTKTGFGIISEAGIYETGFVWCISHSESPLAENLYDFLDPNTEDSLSSQAAAGLIVRSVRSGQPMPMQLFEALWRLASKRGERLRPSRANSFEMLDTMADEVKRYRAGLKSIEQFDFQAEDES
jgi:DNA (cytosine-5)-methyltransferase 1